MQSMDILLFRFGSVPLTVLEGLAAPVGEAYDMRVQVVPTPIPIPQSAFHPGRQQWHASKLVRALAAAPLEPTLATELSRSGGGPLRLGVTEVDLYASQLNFVFGEASQAERAAVLSTARLDEHCHGLPRSQRFEERCATEAVRELGHVLGLPHCSNRSCVMWFSNTLAETDHKGWRLCEACQARLAANMGQLEA